MYVYIQSTVGYFFPNGGKGFQPGSVHDHSPANGENTCSVTGVSDTFGFPSSSLNYDW